MVIEKILDLIETQIKKIRTCVDLEIALVELQCLGKKKQNVYRDTR